MTLAAVGMTAASILWFCVTSNIDVHACHLSTDSLVIPDLRRIKHAAIELGVRCVLFFQFSKEWVNSWTGLVVTADSHNNAK
jgi:hypothetical protein